MFKKTLGALALVITMSFAANSAFAGCSAETEKDGKSACGANQVCYLWEGGCIDKERLYKADGSMPAHSKVADIIEKDHARRRIGVHRFAEQCTDHRIMGPRLAYDRRTKMIKARTKCLESFIHRPAAEIGKTTDDKACRLAACVRINCPHLLHRGHFLNLIL